MCACVSLPASDEQILNGMKRSGCAYVTGTADNNPGGRIALRGVVVSMQGQKPLSTSV